MKSGAQGAENFLCIKNGQNFFPPDTWQMMSDSLNPLDALIPIFIFAKFWVQVTPGAQGSVSVGFWGGGRQLSPFWGGRGVARGLYRPPPPQSQKPTHPFISGAATARGVDFGRGSGDNTFRRHYPNLSGACAGPSAVSFGMGDQAVCRGPWRALSSARSVPTQDKPAAHSPARKRPAVWGNKRACCLEAADAPCPPWQRKGCGTLEKQQCLLLHLMHVHAAMFWVYHTLFSSTCFGFTKPDLRPHLLVSLHTFAPDDSISHLSHPPESVCCPHFMPQGLSCKIAHAHVLMASHTFHTCTNEI